MRLGRLRDGYLSLWRRLRGGRLFAFFALHYTLLFWALEGFVFAAFAREGRSFVWAIDGAAQHLPRLIYLSKTLREAVRSLISGGGFSFPLYDFRNGLCVQDTQYGPIELLSALWPWDGMDGFYRLYVLSGFYLCGLTFAAMGLYFGQKPLPVMTGAVAYAFCGYTLHQVTEHPFYAMPAILLPVLVVGAEKILRGERGGLMTAAVFLSVTAHFGVYFSCMQAILVLAYVLIRFFDGCSGRGARALGRLLGRLCLWGGAGALLGGFTAVPTLLAILGSARVGNDVWPYYSALAYPRTYYQGLVTHLIGDAGAAGFDAFLGFSGLTLPALLLLFARRRRERRSLRACLLLLTVMLCVPAVGYVMSGFSNLSNRFCYAYALCAAAAVMFTLPEFETAGRRDALMLCAALALGVAAGYAVAGDALWRARGLGMAAAAMLALPLCRALRGRRAPIAMLACLLFTCVCVCRTASGKYAPEDGDDPAWDGAASGFAADAYEAYRQGQYSSLSLSEAVRSDDSFFRVAGDAVGSEEMNMAFRYGLNGLSAYPYYGYSRSYFDWTCEMELSRDDLVHKFYGLSSRAPMLTLAGVKYFASRETGREVRPYGFAPLERIENGEKADNILRNEYALPVGYTYAQYMSRERYDALSALGKQEAQLQACVLETPPHLASLTEADVTPSARQIPCRVAKTDGVTWEDGALRVERPGAQMTLEFDGLPQTQTYLRVVGLDLTQGASAAAWTLYATANGARADAYFAADAWVYAHGQHTQLLDLGFAQQGQKSAVLMFPAAGDYRLEGLEIWCQPMDRYAAQVDALREEALTDVTTGPRSLTGRISVSSDKLLVIAIPWLDGWSAYVDGQKTPLYRANTAFMAVELPAGEHEVELRYSLPGLSVGLALSALGAALLLALLAAGRKKTARGTALRRG